MLAFPKKFKNIIELNLNVIKKTNIDCASLINRNISLNLIGEFNVLIRPKNIYLSYTLTIKYLRTNMTIMIGITYI